MNTHSLYTSFVGKLLALIIFTLFAWENVWAADAKWTNGGTFTGNQTITENITIPAGKTVEIDGDLIITSNLTVEGNLIVKGKISTSKSSWGRTVYGSVVVNSGAVITTSGDFIVDKNSVVSVNDDQSGSYYSHIEVGGNLTNSGKINLSGGSIVVGTYETVNGEKVLKNKTGNMSLNAGSYLNYQKANSHVVVRDELNQNKDAYVSIASDAGKNSSLTVLGYYVDLADNSHHPWGLEYTEKTNGNNTQITAVEFKKTNPEFLLSVEKYSITSDKREFSTGSGLFDWFLNLLGIKTSQMTGDAKNQLAAISKDMLANGYNKDEIDLILNKVSSLLPISLTSFSASQNGEEIEIAWTTNSEVNNDYFTVEYSIDGVLFKTLETVVGSGTTSEVNDYAITTEASRFSGVVYFRLKQTDYNGEYSYSDVIALQVESANATDLVIYPNPATEYITISGAVTSAFVSDMHGRRIAVPQTSANTFNVAGLSVGTYYMVATTENGKTVLPFVKE